jgi:hypothetical protein
LYIRAREEHVILAQTRRDHDGVFMDWIVVGLFHRIFAEQENGWELCSWQAVGGQRFVFVLPP